MIRTVLRCSNTGTATQCLHLAQARKLACCKYLLLNLTSQRKSIGDLSSPHEAQPENKSRMTDRIASIEWPTIYISIVPRASGILSVISSSIIIFVIFRSASKLSTIYHRIMFAMSTFDIMGSIGMALTSLPMPKEMPQERELGISWPGVRHGNALTCNIQAFSITLGCATMTVYNVSLCIQ